jgi:DHA3 family macrolide efflux protein-like MFS transporter
MNHHAAQSVRLRDVLRNSNFTKLLTGQFISQLGDGLIGLSLMIMVNRLLGRSGAEGAIGILLICMGAPRVAFGLLAGVYVDRLDRKRMMIVSDLARGLVVLSFLFVQRVDQIWIYYIGAFVMAAISTLFDPAKEASVPNLLPKEHLLMANSLSQTSFYMALTSGSALAGILIGALHSPAPAIIFDALSFFVSAAFIVPLPIPHHVDRSIAQDHSARQVWHELKAGLRFVAHQRLLVGALVGFAVMMLGIGAINVLFVPFLVNDLHLPETYLGFIDLVQMIGMLAVTGYIGHLARRFQPWQIIGGGIIALGVFLGAVGWVEEAWVLFPLSFIWGIVIAPAQASATTIMQSTPDEIRGRAISAIQTVNGTTNVISMAVAGLLGAAIGARLAFAAGGVFAIIGGALAWLIMRGKSVSEVTQTTGSIGLQTNYSPDE